MKDISYYEIVLSRDDKSVRTIKSSLHAALEVAANVMLKVIGLEDSYEVYKSVEIEIYAVNHDRISLMAHIEV